MKLEITLNDEQDWEEGLIPNQLAQSITREIVKSIRGSIDKTVIESIERECKRLINSTLEKRITKLADDYIKSAKVKSKHNANELIDISEYLKQIVDLALLERNIGGKIVDIAKQQADSIKNRYDHLFATQLVTKMSDVGLVNKEVAKMLIDK